MAITLPFTGCHSGASLSIPSRVLLQRSWAWGNPRHGQGNQAPSPTALPSQGFLVPPPTLTQDRAAGSRPQPEQSRCGRSETSAGAIGFTGDTDNALEVGLSGFEQTWWHLGTWADGQADSPSRKCRQDAECELVQGPEEAPGLGAPQLVPGGWKRAGQTAARVPSRACPRPPSTGAPASMSTLTPLEQPQAGVCSGHRSPRAVFKGQQCFNVRDEDAVPLPSALRSTLA